MIDPFTTLWHVIIVILITSIIGYIFNWNVKYNYIEIAVLFAVIYICISKYLLPTNKLNLPLKQFINNPLPYTQNHSSNSYHPRSEINKPLYNGIRVDEHTFPDSVQKYYDTEIPIMGPLDGLTPGDVNTRLTYLYKKTATPYKPMTYFDFVSDSDKLLTNAGKYQILNGPTQNKPRELNEYRSEMERWYPTMSNNQINERDCTNFAPGTPGSCLIKPESLLSESEKNLVEKFENYTSQPRDINTLKTLPTLFKNAPNYRNADDTETTVDISQNISRGGKIGMCRSDYCGSRVLEPGNDNIIGIGQMISAYLGREPIN